MTRHNSVLSPAEVVGPVTALTAGAATITLDLTTLRNPLPRSHWMAAVEFYSDSAGTTAVTPTSGTVTFTVKVSVLPSVFLPLEWQQSTPGGGGVVNMAVLNEPVDWDAGGVHAVKAVMASISGGGATHCRVRLRGDGV